MSDKVGFYYCNECNAYVFGKLPEDEIICVVCGGKMNWHKDVTVEDMLSNIRVILKKTILDLDDDLQEMVEYEGDIDLPYLHKVHNFLIELQNLRHIVSDLQGAIDIASQDDYLGPAERITPEQIHEIIYKERNYEYV